MDVVVTEVDSVVGEVAASRRIEEGMEGEESSGEEEGAEERSKINASLLTMAKRREKIMMRMTVRPV